MIYHNVLKAIGETPIIELQRMNRPGSGPGRSHRRR